MYRGLKLIALYLTANKAPIVDFLKIKGCN